MYLQSIVYILDFKPIDINDFFFFLSKYVNTFSGVNDDRDFTYFSLTKEVYRVYRGDVQVLLRTRVDTL